MFVIFFLTRISLVLIFSFFFFFLRIKCKKFVLWYNITFVTRNVQIKDVRGEAQGRNLLFTQAWDLVRGLQSIPWYIRQGRRGNTWSKLLEGPSSCHRVNLTLIYTAFFVCVNLFNWFEFTKEWLIQNCLWQKYTLLWLYSSGSNIVMGLLRGRKWIEFLSNDHDSTFCEFHLLPFMLLTLYPFHC